VTPVTITITNLLVPSGDNFMPLVGVTIPSGYSNLEVRLDLSNWAATDNIFILASYSTDGGTNWADEGGVGTNGGVHFARGSTTVVTLTGFNVDVPTGVGVKVRAHFIVPSSQHTSGTLTLT
jgi:hypothetical protein